MRPFTAEDIDEAEAAASAIAGGSFPSAFAFLARDVLRLAPLAREALTLRRDLARVRLALGWPEQRVALAATSPLPALISPRIKCGCPTPERVQGASACGGCGFPIEASGSPEAHAEAQRADGR